MLKLLSLFTGIGAFERALDNLEIPFELVNYSEIDEMASKSYSLIHNVDESKNLGDIFKIETNTLPDFDLVTYGFPCTSLSVMGKQEGFADKNKSGLFFESTRIIHDKQPKFAIGENVKALLHHDNGETLKIALKTLDEIGYNTYYKLMISTDFDIPQARERVFLVSIRKDIDQGFTFPIGKSTTKTVKDFIDYEFNTEVGYRNAGLKIHGNNVKLHSRTVSENNLVLLLDLHKLGLLKSGFTDGRLYSIDGGSPTLTTKNGPPSFYEIGRRLNSRERMRLQGFTDVDYDKIKDIISDAQIIKQTGNSITVNTVQAIIEQLNKTYNMDSI